MADKTEDLVIPGVGTIQVIFHQGASDPEWTDTQIAKIMGVLNNMMLSPTIRGKFNDHLILPDTFTSNKPLTFYHTEGESQGGVINGEPGVRLNEDTLTSHYIINKDGYAEFMDFERLIIHETIHALSSDSINDENLSDLMSTDPDFQGETVRLTNTAFDEIPSYTGFSNRMAYKGLSKDIDYHYLDPTAENDGVVKLNTSFTNGQEIDQVYIGSENSGGNLGGNNDQMAGTTGIDLLLGFSGDDTFYMTEGADWVYGGPGTDTISFVNAPEAVDIEIGAAGEIDLLFGGFNVQDNFFSIERIVGTAEDDYFSYSGDLSTFPLTEIDGGDGSDTLYLLDRTEAAVFTIGSDAGEVNLTSFENIILSDYDDKLTLTSLDTLSGFDMSGDRIPVYIDGGEGIDTLDFSANTEGVYSDDVFLADIERIILSGNDDDVAFHVFSSEGQAILIDANTGDDYAFVGATNEEDRIIAFGGDGADGFDISLGSSDVYGGIGDDVTLFADGLYGAASYVFGGAGDDEVTGIGNVHLFGGAGADTVEVLIESDAEIAHLYGTYDAGLTDTYSEDAISSQRGNQSQIDDGAADRLIGSEGNEVFHVGNGDMVIPGYGDGGDTFKIYANVPSYADILTSGGNSDFIFVPNAGELNTHAIGLGYSTDDDYSFDVKFVLFFEAFDDPVSGQEAVTIKIYTQNDSNAVPIFEMKMRVFNSVSSTANYVRYIIETGEFSFVGTSGNQAEEYLAAGGNDIGGTILDDDIDGTAAADTISGLMGNDVIHGLGGDDLIYGGLRDDVLYGDAGDDQLEGGIGEDTLWGGSGNDILNGGDGDDVRLDGQAGDDVINGGAGADSIYGQLGNDILHGDAGDDFISGSDGIDIMFGDAGDDLLIGGNGNDIMDGGIGVDRLAGGAGDDNLLGGDGDDRLFGQADNDTVSGGDGDDFVSGELGDDMLFGGAGNDKLFGSVGLDSLLGGDGDDILNGGADADRIDGGAGVDLLTGGTGVDTFVFDFGAVASGEDTLFDFAVGEDMFEIGGGLVYADLVFTASPNGQHTTVSYNGHSIYVKNATIAELNAAQFTFIPVAETPDTGKAVIAEDIGVSEKAVVSDDNSFVYVEKSVVADDDIYLSGDVTTDQDILAAFLEAAQDLGDDFINNEDVLNVGFDADYGVPSYFTDYNFA